MQLISVICRAARQTSRPSTSAAWVATSLFSLLPQKLGMLPRGFWLDTAMKVAEQSTSDAWYAGIPGHDGVMQTDRTRCTLRCHRLKYSTCGEYLAAVIIHRDELGQNSKAVEHCSCWLAHMLHYLLTWQEAW